MKLASYNIEAKCDLETQRASTDLSLFLRLCNVLRLFFPNFAQINAPLNAELKTMEPKELYHLPSDEAEPRATIQQIL